LNLFNVLLLAAVLFTGPLFLAISGEALVAEIALLLAIALRLMAPVGSLARAQAQLTQVAPMLQAILDLVQGPAALAPHGGSLPFVGLQQGVRLAGVTFCYAPDEPPVLQALDLEIPCGQMTAVVGASGAGKSSLVNLLARLYDPTEGHIYVDGVDLRDLALTTWRRHLAVVSQDVFLFHATVLDNLRFARPEATDEEIVRACRLAQAHEFIAALPHGYDTVLQEQGVRLSGGQQQRIALARALLVDADLLILDEATSELDAPTERAIQQALETYRQGRTVLVIAHRLSTVAQADQIYVLDSGRLVEKGSHDDLVARRSVYWRLVQAQRLDVSSGPRNGEDA
jgi:subfamily B ATP-binding cassette protein MsbA